MKKVLSVLSIMMILFVMAGCNSKKVDSNQDITDVRLKWIMPGPGEQPDSDSVWEEFNKQLKKYPGLEHVNVEFEVIPSADYKQKFLLMQAGNESMDIIQTYTLDFAADARNGTFLALDDLVEKDGSELKKELPSWLWGFGQVDGKTYMIPIYQQMNAPIWGVRTQKALADKYWDVDRAEKVFRDNKTFSEVCYDVIEEYLAKLKENGEIRLGFTGGMQSVQGYETVAGQYAVNIYDEHPKVTHSMLTPESKLKYSKTAEWFKKGYIRKDVLSAEAAKDIGKENGYVVWFEQTMRGAEKQNKEKYGFDVTVISPQDHYYIPFVSAAGGNSISSGSKHSKEAMKLLEVMNTKKGKELYNLAVFGMEGKHYKQISEDRIETIGYVGEATSSVKYGLWKWIVGNAYMAKDTQAETEGWKNYIYKEINENGNGKTTYSKLIGFTPDLSAIEAKMAQVKAVSGEFGKALGSGALPNEEQVYQQFVDKINKAGNQEVTEELQRQIDKFLAAKKQ